MRHLLALLALFTLSVHAIDYPAPIKPGKAKVQNNVVDDKMVLYNRVIELHCTNKNSFFKPEFITNRLNGKNLQLSAELFEVKLADGTVLAASDFRVLKRARKVKLETDRLSTRIGERDTGLGIELLLQHQATKLTVIWRAELRDNSNYIRTRVQLKSSGDTIALNELVLFDRLVPGSSRIGEVKGSLMLYKDIFLGYEHPMANNSNNATQLHKIYDYDSNAVAADKIKVKYWDVTKEITNSGEYQFEFRHHKGKNRLEIVSVELLENGYPIDIDEHLGWSDNKVDVKQVYTLKVRRVNRKSQYEIRTKLRTAKGVDSRGVINCAYQGQLGWVHCGYSRNSKLAKGEVFTGSMIYGVAPPRQLRRAFSYYIERERTNSYRTFLNYNSWYDIGYFTKYSEKDCLEIVNAYKRELSEKRGVKIDSFLFDDGWDDHQTLWNFHKGFNDGFTKVSELCAAIDSAPGVWLSPWGGYEKPRKMRVDAGRKAGFEIYENKLDPNQSAFKLSGEKYYERYSSICKEMMTKYGVNQFKFDGLGQAVGGTEEDFSKDFEAAIKLIEELKELNSQVFINLTTGTWGSPFWLLHVDSIWRGGYDHEFIGVGSNRQKWMTFRDAQTYKNIVKKAPLYPLNSLMLHGVIYAKHARGLNSDPNGDLQSEIRTAFGCGTQLQELYISPAMMSEKNWDDLAESAKWARKNAKTLADVHWIGGDPEALEVYGWGAWSSEKGIITLRNPSDKSKLFTVDVKKDLEIPFDQKINYKVVSPFKQRIDSLNIEKDGTILITLMPWEVLVFELKKK